MTDNGGQEFQLRINPQDISLMVCVFRTLGSSEERDSSEEKRCADAVDIRSLGFRTWCSFTSLCDLVRYFNSLDLLFLICKVKYIFPRVPGIFIKSIR